MLQILATGNNCGLLRDTIGFAFAFTLWIGLSMYNFSAGLLSPLKASVKTGLCVGLAKMGSQKLLITNGKSLGPIPKSN